MKLLFIIIYSFILIGCSTRGAVFIKEQNLSLIHIKKSINDTFPGGVDQVSTNGREHISKPFLYVRGKFRVVNEVKTRYRAKVIILGDRRPYDIEVLVFKERQNKLDYTKVGPHPGLTKKVHGELKRNLTKRRGDGNIVDDFRVF